MRDFHKTLRWLAVALVGSMLGIFIAQNAAVIELRFFTTTVSSRRAFVVITCVLLGFAVGWLFGYTARRK